MSEDFKLLDPAPHIPGLIRKAWQVIAKNLANIPGAEELGAELTRYLVQVQGILASQDEEIEKNRRLLEEYLRFEEFASELSGALMAHPLEQTDGAIDRACGEICRFFAADGACFFEVEPEYLQIRLLSMANGNGPQPQFIEDLVSGNILAYRRLVQQGEPIVRFGNELPAQETTLPLSWRNPDLSSLLALPLRTDSQVTHLIALWNHVGKPELPPASAKRLRFLGDIVACFLGRLRDRETLGSQKTRMAEAQRIAHLGSWEWNILSGEITWSDEVYRIFGLSPHEFRVSYQTFLNWLHPDDRPGVEEAVEKAMADPTCDYAIEHRAIRPDGTIRVVRERGEVIRDRMGRAVRMIGTVLDVTDSRETEEALQSALLEIEQYKEQLEAENIYLREEMRIGGEGLPNIIGESDSIAKVLLKLRQVAQGKTTVLLTGETGTGKGVFARALHAISNRKGKAFVQVNCAGLPPNLIESELFGREKGAFTGSTMRQIGRFELADGGTIFLDEIGELPLDLQAKLLKVVEDGEFERLGSPHPVRVDVRIIASTNRRLEEEIAGGYFRSDLFYRLNVFPIEIPPLRERMSDIPLLVKFYVDRFNKSYGKRIARIPKEVMKTFDNYSWPGNVRELINIVERAVIVSDGSELRLTEQPESVPVVAAPRKEKQRKMPGVQLDSPKDELKGLAEVEREHMVKTLESTGWRIEGTIGAATRLGLKPSTLRAKMKKLGIQRPGAKYYTDK